MADPRGTSFEEFEYAFPDEQSCIDHMARIRRPSFKCGCKSPRPWKPMPGSPKQYRHVCGQSRSVISETAFARTAFPIRDLFYGMLLFANAERGLPGTFLQSHMGFGVGSSVKFKRRIRNQLALLEQGRRVGGPGTKVNFDIAYLDRIRTRNRKGAGRARILLVGDDTQVVSCVTQKIERRLIHPFLKRVILPGSIVQTHNDRLLATLKDHNRYKDYDHVRLKESLTSFAGVDLFHFSKALKSTLKVTYRSTPREDLWLYLKEFEFRFNRRGRGKDVFWEMIGDFPRCNRDVLAALRSEFVMSRPEGG